MHSIIYYHLMYVLLIILGRSLHPSAPVTSCPVDDVRIRVDPEPDILQTLNRTPALIHYPSQQQKGSEMYF